MKIQSPGFYDISAAEYHGAEDICPTPSLSSSVAAALVSDCPAIAKAMYDGRMEESNDAADLGSVCHRLLLGRGKEIRVIDCADFRTKAAQQAKADAIAAGQLPIKVASFERAKKAILRWSEQLDAYGLGYIFTEGASEQAIAWQEIISHETAEIPTIDDRIVWCRAMLDRWLPDHVEIDKQDNRILSPEIWDLKTGEGVAHPEKIARRIGSNDAGGNLYVRSEFYKRGVERLIPELAGRVKFGFLFADVNEPFLLTPVLRLGAQWERFGSKRVDTAIQLWGECLATNSWPSYVTKPIEKLEVPKWQMTKELEARGEATEDIW